MSHAWHCPVHAPLQHTPSTQLPLVHSVPALQACPFGKRSSHNPAEQTCPAPHGVVVEHCVHAVPAQTYGSHCTVCLAGHDPVPEQNACFVAILLAHAGARHSTLVPG